MYINRLSLFTRNIPLNHFFSWIEGFSFFFTKFCIISLRKFVLYIVMIVQCNNSVRSIFEPSIEFLWPSFRWKNDWVFFLQKTIIVSTGLKKSHKRFHTFGIFIILSMKDLCFFFLVFDETLQWKWSQLLHIW